MIAREDIDDLFVRRFWSKIDRAGDCWLWRAGRFANGYGQYGIKVRGQWKNMKAHRFAYLITYGYLPERPLELRHNVCGNKLCCRPDHITEGTHQDNAYDTTRMGRNACGPRNGMHTHPGCNAGSRSGNTKLVEADIVRIRELHATGTTVKELMGLFGLKDSQLYNIVNRVSWTHVP